MNVEITIAWHVNKVSLKSIEATGQKLQTDTISVKWLF